MKKRIKNLYIWLDYSLILPFLAFLPHKVGRYMARARGIIYFKRKRDWRIFTFGDYGLWDKIYNSYKEIFADASDEIILELVKQRFINQSIEEYEANLVIQDKYRKIEVEYEGLENIKPYIDGDKNAVFVTGHFGSIYGFSFFDILKAPLYAMTTDIKQYANIHPSILKLNANKYDGLKPYMNGGSVLTIEGNRKKFIKYMKSGANSVVIVDLPPNSKNEDVNWKEFFGKVRGFASGANRLAKISNSDIIPYVCYYEDGKYTVRFGKSSDEAYGFLEREIKQRAGMWWATDLLQSYPIKEK